MSWLYLISLAFAASNDTSKSTGFHCPFEEKIVSLGGGVFGSQGLVDVWTSIDGDVMITLPIKYSCFRYGFREHITWGLPWIEYGARGDELIFKSHAMFGYYASANERINLGAYLLAGLKSHHVRQEVNYAERNLAGAYKSTAHRPSFYWYSVVDYFPLEHWGMGLNFSLPLVDFDREIYWYNNRILGVSLQWKG